MPLGKRRERARGYNQAAEIAKLFAESAGFACEEEYFVRTRNTSPQTEVGSSKERVQNVKDCFAATSPEKFPGKHVILVDDVTTSGATFLAASETLKAAGARNILALAVAKA